MASGNITRIIGGKNSIEAEEWIVYTEKFTAYAGKGSHFTADKGTNIGNPKKAPSVGHYFKKAWWSSDYEGNKKITKAKVGDKVYFQIEMTDKFPQASLPKEKQQKVTFSLYEFTGNMYSIAYMYVYGPRIYLDKEPQKDKEIRYVTWEDKNKNDKIDPEEEYSKKPYNEEKANGNKVVISFQLSDALSSYFNEIGELKLFMSVSYDWATVDLPEDEELYLNIEPKPPVIKEIYVRLLNYQVSSAVNLSLKEIEATQQKIRGNDDKQSAIVNMDYFSVRIDRMPELEGGVMQLYKLLKQNFLTLSAGSLDFKGHGIVARQLDMVVNGNWKFRPYPKENDLNYVQKQVEKWFSEVGNPIFYIEAGSNDLKAKSLVDHGAVVVSEFSDMCWLFTTIYTDKSDSQPFSGHRQFGIHQDEDGCYRVYTRALDRVWPSRATSLANAWDMDDTVKDYLTIANNTWNTYMKNVLDFIIKLGGTGKIMEPEIVRTTFANFNANFTTSPTLQIGNIPQEKEYEK
ncbi:hypothetical protein [Chryseobacterium sp. BIGb0232]|uniref:hypothetical protein n=1 Tax=Chryseobacterium sp. BIGb0232 TaxID=2940598 RepID=UPI000F47F0A1|nr:hypothetical protein [Chryseobacterium sp. BIGb0232]MCS4302884.1 hypothetical protein [Chryseobacterium sp. BIGb0232]ROS17536.1 hypothetical protein EDF65_1908 [Chryseobacterium nakagawai]